jgi:hypothetical protein
MRSLFGSLVSLLVMVVIGCNTVDPDECWPNTSGGFGGSGTIPIGAGVGATTGGDFISPPRAPLAASGTPNPCVAPEASTSASFSPSEFLFFPTIPDDGTDKGGGWQVARANLEFERVLIPRNVTKWYCPFNIEMPLRTEGMGEISARYAARLSVEITEGVAEGMDYSLPQGIFCEQFVLRTRAAFKSKYPLLGASVTK